jgi:hypothetical protein
MLKKLKYIIPFLIILIAVGVGAYLLGYHNHKHPSPAVTSIHKSSATTVKTPAKQTPATPSYYVGDSQTDGNLVITLDSTGGGTTMGELPANDTIFSVNITVKNTGSTPYTSADAFVDKSSVYTQVGKDTSTGQYNPAMTTPCFGGGNVFIPPSQDVTGCVQFIVPKDALVDTYFYDNLKWYL